MTDQRWFWLIGIIAIGVILWAIATVDKKPNYNDCDYGSKCAEHFHELECGRNGVFADDPEICP